MASTYKTPGVYVEEISIFPPSVAQVETAIPAFIGYTKSIKHKAENDLLLTPKKVSSMLEFVSLFGGAPDIDIDYIKLNASNEVVDFKTDDNYYLYESMRLFYANGGGDCYVVSVGKTDGGAVLYLDLKAGLDKIAKVDEPTLLVAPDAALMSQADMNNLHQDMLQQCGKLGDRFSIFDLKNDPTDGDEFDTEIANFRNGIGMNNLKYGAAYTPWLKANLPREISYKSIKGKISSGGSSKNLADLISDTDATTLANQLDQLVTDNATLSDQYQLLIAPASSTDSKFESVLTTLKQDSTFTNLQSLLQYYASAIDLIRDAVEVGDSNFVLTQVTPLDTTDSLFTHLETKFKNSLTAGTLNDTVETIKDIVADFDATYASSILPTSNTGIDYTTGTAGNVFFQGSGNQGQEIASETSKISALYIEIKSALDYIQSTAQSYLETYEAAAVEVIPALKNIKTALGGQYITLPPSAAIAGVYARVDSNRGVWKAPANTSLNSVVGVTELIDNDSQRDLNVDVVSGKSINVIRPFTGKGIMVWGARTLAGNDNEWRYVPVRRFFNMVEESVKKATEQFVFEGNDANTWVKVRAMIENFLNLQWRAGALAGAKPNDAFYVRVGLGETMTAEDVLNGIMAIEIGMAIVRPAEFIILKFSHKMQES